MRIPDDYKVSYSSTSLVSKTSLLNLSTLCDIFVEASIPLSQIKLT